MQEIIKNYKFLENQDIASFKLSKNQGHCNECYVLTTAKDKFIMKKFRGTQYDTSSKNNEFEIQKRAYKKKVTSKPIELNHKDRIFISKFIQGHNKDKISLADLPKIANLLQSLHSIKIIQKPFAIKKYLKKNTKILDKSFRLAFLRISIFKKDYVLCHNDLNCGNIIFSHDIKFIDFEYACVNDRYFDLASFIIEFDLNRHEENLFLHFYFRKKLANRKKITLYKKIYKQVCKIWLIK